MVLYEQGDIVRILPYAEIASQFTRGRELPSGCRFGQPMEQYCEKELRIVKVLPPFQGDEVGFYKLDGITNWTFTDEMLQDATQVPADINLSLSFDELMEGSD